MIPFRPGTILVFFTVVGAALAAFGIWGILVAAFCALLTVTPMIAEARARTLAALVVVILLGMVLLDFCRIVLYTGIYDGPPWYGCQFIQLRQIGQALQKYHEAYGSFPPAYVANDRGEPIHSWRALILPYIDDVYQHDKYDLNEPWNGTHNRKLASHEGTVFHCPLDTPRNPTKTSYVAVVGRGTGWKGNQGRSLKDFTDGPNQTALIVEMLDSDIDWMEPRDITLEQAVNGSDGKASVPSCAHTFPGGYFFGGGTMAGCLLMADGSVVGLAVRPSSTDMAALLSIDGNEHVDILKYQEAMPAGAGFRWDHIIGLPVFLAATMLLWLRQGRQRES